MRFIAAVCLAAAGLVPLSAQADEVKDRYKEDIAAYEKSKDGALAYAVGLDFYNAVNGAPQSYAKAFEWFSKAAAAGYPGGMRKLGDCYALGLGLKEDKAKGLKWYSRAAELGDPEAQENAAEMYYYGNGAGRNYALAMKWYKKASAGGRGAAVDKMIGWMYVSGEGVEKNYAEALNWFTRAFERGDADSAASIAMLYKNSDGKDMPPDGEKRLEWLRKGVEAGSAVCMQDLSGVYADGDGLPKDEAEAYAWLTVVNEKTDNNVAERHLAELSARITPADLARGKKLAQERLAKYVTQQDRDDRAYLRTLDHK